MSILNVPIQINGGVTKPNRLLDRELYIDGNGFLYYGNGSTPQIINARKSYTLGNITSDVYVSSGEETGTYPGARFGDIFIGKNTNNNIWAINGSEYKAHIYQVTINACRMQYSEISTLQKLAVSGNQIYGTELPYGGSDGQVFFKV